MCVGAQRGKVKQVLQSGTGPAKCPGRVGAPECGLTLETSIRASVHLRLKLRGLSVVKAA